MKAVFALTAVSVMASASAFTINFVNKCSYGKSLRLCCQRTGLTNTSDVWAAVGAAPNGQPDLSIAWGQKVSPGGSASTGVDDHALVRLSLH